MATAWPSTIPQCPMQDLTKQKQPNLAMFSPDVGQPKVRRRSTAAIWIYSMAFKMTDDELTTFNAFYETSLADGSLPFTWQSVDWIFDPKEAPQINRMTHNTWRVSFNAFQLP